MPVTLAAPRYRYVSSRDIPSTLPSSTSASIQTLGGVAGGGAAGAVALYTSLKRASEVRAREEREEEEEEENILQFAS